MAAKVLHFHLVIQSFHAVKPQEKGCGRCTDPSLVCPGPSCVRVAAGGLGLLRLPLYGKGGGQPAGLKFGRSAVLMPVVSAIKGSPWSSPLPLEVPAIGFVSWTLKTPTFLSGGNAFIRNVIISWPHAPCDIGSAPRCGHCRGVLVQGVGPCDPVAPGNWGHAVPGDPLASRLVQVDGKASLSLQPGSLWAKVPAGSSWMEDLDARVNTLLC